MNRPPTIRVLWNLGRWIAFVALAMVLMLIEGPRTSLNPRSTVPNMVDGTAARPYVKRAMVGMIVRGLRVIAPAEFRTGFANTVRQSGLLHGRLRWEPAHALEFALVFFIHLAALTGFAAALEWWLRTGIGASSGLAFTGALAGLVLLPLHFGYQNFIYDFPGLALMTAGICLIAARRWMLLYLLWPIGVLNKETFVLLIPIFLVFEGSRMSAVSLRRHVLAQVSISAVVILGLAVAFRSNPGPPLEHHFVRNITLHPPPRQLFHDLAYWGFVGFSLVGWRVNPRLTAATLITLGILFVTTLFFGFLGEYRDFYEAWPLLIAGMLIAAAALLKWMTGWDYLPRAGRVASSI